MKKIRIIQNDEVMFESEYYYTYEEIVVVNFDKLNKVDLRHADLRHADLRCADLRNADLYNADLKGVDLSDAYLSDANLSCAKLNNADLRCAYLKDVDLSYADLSDAYLYNANLRNADLSNANLTNANLTKTILDEKELIRKGMIIKKKQIVYKKCKDKIVELELLKGAIVFSINNYKCRTNKAKVISIDGSKEKGLKISSNYDKDFIYEVGKTIEVEDFNLMYNVECATGIHFFFKKEDAEKYF